MNPTAGPELTSPSQFETSPHWIGSVGTDGGPTVVFVAGVHGNEPAGIEALRQIHGQLSKSDKPIQGRVFFLIGNPVGLAQGQRFIWHDLNRIWTHEYITHARMTEASIPDEQAELQQLRTLLRILDSIREQATGPRYFFDLHTTSAPSPPFIALNDQLANRQFAMPFPVPAVLGLEEFLPGTMLSFLNETGDVSMAFEAGQHTDPASVTVHAAFVWQVLLRTGIIEEPDGIKSTETHQQLRLASENFGGIYEVIERHAVAPGDGFQMHPGFRSFQAVTNRDPIAIDERGPIRPRKNGLVFMPLYQASGSDGFFVVRTIPRWALTLSAFLRRINFDRVLVWLPGISRSRETPETLIVNRRVARFYATELFHLLGYRRKKATSDQLLFSRREIH